MDKLLKITTVNGKILTLCKKFRERAMMWHTFYKKWMDENGCVPWMKTSGFLTNGEVGRETIDIGYISNKNCVQSEMSKKTSRCLK